jgi:ribosomal protein L40E
MSNNLLEFNPFNNNNNLQNDIKKIRHNHKLEQINENNNNLLCIKCKIKNAKINFICRKCNFLLCDECIDLLSKTELLCDENHNLDLKLSDEDMACRKCNKQIHKKIDLIYYCNFCDIQCFCLNCI